MLKDEIKNKFNKENDQKKITIKIIETTSDK